MASMYPLLFVYVLVDMVKCAGMSLLRGTGRPLVTVYGNVLAMLFVGYPVCFALSRYTDLGFHGVWWGITAGWAAVGVAYCAILCFTDWTAQVQAAAREVALNTEVEGERLSLTLDASVTPSAALGVCCLLVSFSCTSEGLRDVGYICCCFLFACLC
jgi:hypothetical protein